MQCVALLRRKRPRFTFNLRATKGFFASLIASGDACAPVGCSSRLISIICRAVQTRIAEGEHAARIRRPNPNVKSVKPRSYAGDDLKRSVGRIIKKRERSRNLLKIRRQRIEPRRKHARNDAACVSVKGAVEISDDEKPLSRFVYIFSLFTRFSSSRNVSVSEQF